MNDDQLIEKWLNDTPVDESADTVERILKKYFGPESVNKKSGGSHHYRVKHPALACMSHFGIGGHLSVPVSHGKRVKKVYLKWIAQAIKRLEEVDCGEAEQER